MNKRLGFTLIELAIVLILIGLIAGGIIVGQSMLHQAELRTVIADLKNFEDATKQFQDKYNALPGDMYNAEDFWGADASCPNTTSNAVPKTATCDGNGDGKVYDVLAASERYESFRYWQQLSNAELIEGRYTGVTGSGSTTDAVNGVNVPVSDFNNIGYGMAYLGYYTSASGDAANVFDALFTNIDYGHVVTIGADSGTVGGDLTFFTGLTPVDARSLDVKLDDGYANTGKLIAPDASVTECAEASGTIRDYDMSQMDASKCMLLYSLGL